MEGVTAAGTSVACKANSARWICRADKKAVRQTISANSEPDLFWGMRGAGGSLGVAIEYTTYAFAVPENVRISAPQLCRILQALDWQCSGRSLTGQARPCLML